MTNLESTSKMMKRLLTPLLIFAAFTVIAESKLSIVNGRDALLGEFPYMVSVQVLADKYTHMFGGSILTPSWVLVCVGVDLDDSYRVVAGIVELNGTNPERQERNVIKVINHPDFHESRSGIKMNYIGLIQLEAPLEFNKFVQPIELPKSGSSAVGLAIATGWGFIKELRPTNTLQTVAVSILSDPDCEYSNSEYNKTIHLCVDSNDKGACYFDDGGPLVQSGKAVGILEDPKDCASGTPDIFTKVSNYIDFIEKYIHPSNEDKSEQIKFM